MKDRIQEFRMLFDIEMGRFIDRRLKEISYEAAAYAQQIVNSYEFPDDKTPLAIHNEIERYLDYFEVNLMESRPLLADLANNEEETTTSDI